jgi:hypothetical protein
VGARPKDDGDTTPTPDLAARALLDATEAGEDTRTTAGAIAAWAYIDPIPVYTAGYEP